MSLDYSKMTNVNEIHDTAILEHFRNGIGHKTLVISPSYPYMFVGMIK